MSKKPSWYPENPFFKKARAYLELEDYGADHHYTEIGIYWSEGAEALYEAVKKLPVVNGITFIPDKEDWLPHSEYEKKREEAASRNLWGFAGSFSENDSHWRAGRDEILDKIRHLPSAKKVKGGIRVSI